MTCFSAAAMALFLNTITAPVSSTDTGLTVHATEGDVHYIRIASGFCWMRG